MLHVHLLKTVRLPVHKQVKTKQVPEHARTAAATSNKRSSRGVTHLPTYDLRGVIPYP